jgi:hypothetical protein
VNESDLGGFVDDDELLAVVRAALADEAAVANEHPALPMVMESGRAVWSWRTIDEELAELAYDSADRPALAGLRGGVVPPRQMTFALGDVRLELEISQDAVLGQVLPPRPVHVQVEVPGGPGRELDSDGQGRFVVEPALSGPVRLRCSMPDAAPVVTGWVLL